jgi:ATP-dependent RNA helicase RhlE
MMTFDRLNLTLPILQALNSKGYTHPTPIQEKAIPLILDGKDIFGSARTGTGKTAAFALPVMQLMSQANSNSRATRALVLAPTRELAQQISESFHAYGKNLGLRHTVIYGGVSQRPQVDSLRRGTDIIIATPGRLLDLIQQGHVRLNAVEFLILDEADRMLDMGFINDIRKICAMVPTQRQTLLFSATISSEIKKLAGNLLNNPVSIDIKPDLSLDTVTLEQVYFIDRVSKTDLLQHLVDQERIDRSLVFTRTKRGADKLVKALAKKGILAQAIHGNKSQSQRTKALDQFKSRKVHMLVATDVAARGIDVRDLSHVINYDLPEQSETYTHRIGRTGRAGQDGIAYSFCSPEEKSYLKDIQKFTGKSLAVAEHPYTAIAGPAYRQERVKEEMANGNHSNGNQGNHFKRRRNQPNY